MKSLPSNWKVRKGGLCKPKWWQILENGTVLDARPSAASACIRAHGILKDRRLAHLRSLAGVYR